jgi:homoserine O-acetyltransferase
MSYLATPTTGTHVEAFRSTGSSPGRTLPLRHPAGDVLTVPLVLDRSPIAPRVPIRFEVQGPPDAPVVVVLGGISAGRHLAPTPQDPTPGWWPGVLGAGCALDPGARRLVGVDWIGGPATSWRAPCPLTPADQARALAAVLDHLGVDAVTLVGSSYGGMVALAFAAAYPRRVDHALVLCAAHRAHPMATAVRSVQRGILRLGLEAGREREAVALARALAMTTYRSPREFEERFAWRDAGQRPDDPCFPVDGYLEARGADFSGRFDADAYLSLCTSIDLHDLDPATVTAPTTLVSVDSDALAPPWLLDELAAAAPGVRRHVRLSSPYGHDAFLKEAAAVSSVVRTVLDGEVAR